MNFLAKTRKRVTDASGEFAGLLNDRADKFMDFLTTNADTAYTRPWHKLEPGIRKNRIRLFAAEEAERFNFSADEQQRMFDTLMKALEKKQLTSKSTVTYDQDQQKILEIKGFSFHKSADGTVQFQFSERKTGTMRRKNEPKQTAQAPSKEPTPQN
jgi:hypothetical protein